MWLGWRALPNWHVISKTRNRFFVGKDCQVEPKCFKQGATTNEDNCPRNKRRVRRVSGVALAAANCECLLRDHDSSGLRRGEKWRRIVRRVVEQRCIVSAREFLRQAVDSAWLFSAESAPLVKGKLIVKEVKSVCPFGEIRTEPLFFKCSGFADSDALGGDHKTPPDHVGKRC